MQTGSQLGSHLLVRCPVGWLWSLCSSSAQFAGYRWTSGLPQASFDLILLAASDARQPVCSQCRFVASVDPRHARFMQLRLLMSSQEWEQHVVAMQQYAFVYLPEDGVVQTAAMADR